MKKDELTNQTPADAKTVLPAVRSFKYWTKKELEALPAREWNEDIGEFDSLIILPTKHLDDSGFWCMDFVAVKGNEPFCRLSGCSDVIHIDGIGGYSEWKQNVPTVIPHKGWSIDCLKKSKLLRLSSDGNLKAGMALPSFDLYSVE